MPKLTKARFGLTMSPELLERIEKRRGLIPRATYIEHCLKQYFDRLESSKEEMKYCDEILAMLPEKQTMSKATLKEEYDKLYIIIENIRMKILGRRKSLLLE